MCDFFVAANDAGLYEVQSGQVDDGIQIMVNGQILGHLELSEKDGGAWPLTNLNYGGPNTLIVILVDNSQALRGLDDLAFFRDGVLIQ